MIAAIDLGDDPGRPARIIDRFFDEEDREAFIRIFKELQNAYEILSPDPFLRDYLDDYALIVQVYNVLYNYFNPEAERRRLQRALLRKTDALIRAHVRAEPVVDTLPLYPINRDIANVVRADQVSERVKVTNLSRSLTVYIEEHRQEQPYLISIGEQVEEIIRRLRERQISVQAALEQLTALSEQVVAAQEEQAESDLSSAEFAIYWVLKAQSIPDPEAVARDLHETLIEHPGWPHNPRLEQEVRTALYKRLIPPPQKAVSEAAGPMQAEIRRVRLLKETVDAVLRVARAVAE
ncbi:MAG: DUF3387 domain-containing protein [Chloroflexi bacterium]|nr:MAG: DUF3387 domain-containing protein [Chloroflexota bacterium]